MQIPVGWEARRVFQVLESALPHTVYAHGVPNVVPDVAGELVELLVQDPDAVDVSDLQKKCPMMIVVSNAIDEKGLFLCALMHSLNLMHVSLAWSTAPSCAL